MATIQRLLAVALVGTTATACSTMPFMNGQIDAAEGAQLQRDVAAARVEIRDLVTQLRSVEQKLPVLPPAKYTIDLVDSPSEGDAHAAIAIVEFSDYQCPFCRRFHDTTYRYLKREFVATGKARFIHRDVPLVDIHPQAQSAAIAARCADQQHKFWSYSDALFDNQDDLTGEIYRTIAKEQSLDMSQFDACLVDPKTKLAIDVDRNYAAVFGVDATPSFFVGRVEGDKVVDAIPLSGAVPFPYFAGAMEKLMRDLPSASVASSARQ